MSPVICHLSHITCHQSPVTWPPLYAASGAMKVPGGLVMRLQEAWWLIEQYKKIKSCKNNKNMIFVGLIKGRIYLTKSLYPYPIKSYTEGKTKDKTTDKHCDNLHRGRFSEKLAAFLDSMITALNWGLSKYLTSQYTHFRPTPSKLKRILYSHDSLLPLQSCFTKHAYMTFCP